MYNTYHAPYLRSYAEALKHFNEVPPIRGSEDAVKPIGKRRYHMCASIERHGDDVHLVFERRAVVIWRPDNTFTLNAPHDYHAHQADKLVGWLPRGFYFTWDSKRLFVCSQDGIKVSLPRNGSLEFVPDDTRSVRYRCVDNTVPVEYKARRMMANKLMRQHFTPFLAWAQVVLRDTNVTPATELQKVHNRFLNDLGYTEELIADHAKRLGSLPYESAWRSKVQGFIYALNRVPFSTTFDRGVTFSRIGCEHLFKLLTSDDYEQWPYALALITRQAGSYRHRMQGASIYSLEYASLETYLKHLVSFLYRDEVFEVKPVKAGTIPSARNAQYFVELEHIF